MAQEQSQSRPHEEGENAPPVSRGAPRLNPERWIEDYGDMLFGFAMSRVRDQGIAQELVQETFLSALKAMQSFAGRSTERAWLFGILRNKLIDQYRLKSREISMADFEASSPEEDGFFQSSGMGKDGWVHRLGPKRWESPDESLVSKEFQQVFNNCLSRLPEMTARVFLLREVDGDSTEETCKDLNISANNLWVTLHRARLALRRCLEIHWFGHNQKNEDDASGGIHSNW